VKDYVALALRTETDYAHYDGCAKNRETVYSLLLALRNFCQAAARLGEWKALLMYGRVPDNVQALYAVQGYADTSQLRRMQDPKIRRLLHAALGFASETGEMAEALERYLRMDEALDRVNIAEELGDLLWYFAVGADALGQTEAQIRDANVAKLRNRYPDRYSDLAEERRDLSAERAVLEAHGWRGELVDPWEDDDAL
jgi:NTP pyrophosphatase (non-canonical NTP hydrolase)